MKLRIRGNSLRLRLTRGEVTTMRADGEVGERIEFPDGAALGYRLQARGDADAIRAELRESAITVVVPTADIRRWADTDAVSLQADVGLTGGESLRVLIEKDFACLADRPDEDDSDAFPHPEAD
ncbi:MAG: hypothetical protein U5K76_15655 [Woeseiaceae bacterium]|nr:hypothetical protein [Woeseiaceae bacterium]